MVEPEGSPVVEGESLEEDHVSLTDENDALCKHNQYDDNRDAQGTDSEAKYICSEVAESGCDAEEGDNGKLTEGMEMKEAEDSNCKGKEEEVLNLMTVSQLHEKSSNGDFGDHIESVDERVTAVALDSTNKIGHTTTCDRGDLLTLSHAEIRDRQEAVNESGKPTPACSDQDGKDQNSTLKSDIDSSTTLNVNSEPDLANKPALLTERSSSHGDSDLMTVSQLYEAGTCPIPAGVNKRNSERTSVNLDGMTVSQLHDRYSARSSINFDGMTVSQLHDITSQDNQTEPADDGESVDKDVENIISTEVERCSGHSDSIHGDVTTVTGCSNDDQRTHVVECLEGTNAVDEHDKCSGDVHKHNDKGSTIRVKSVQQDADTEAGGDNQDATTSICASDSASLISAAQVDYYSSDSTSNANMLCVSNTVETFRTESDVGELDVLDLDKDNLGSHEYTDKLCKDTASSDCIINDDCSNHTESLIDSQSHNHNIHDIGVTADTDSPQTSQDCINSTKPIATTYPLVSGESVEKESEDADRPTEPKTVIDIRIPRNGISGTKTITGLSKDLDITTTNTEHAKLLRLYNQIDLEDKTETLSNHTRDNDHSNRKDIQESPSPSTDEYPTIRRNGSISSVRLRRQKSSPDPGRKGLNGSPLMRVKGICIDDVSSNDSDSPRCSEDSEDEDDDAGIYADSYRMSRWLYLGESDLSLLTDVGNLPMSRSGSSSPSVAGTTSSGTCDSLSDLLDEGHDLLALEGQEEVKDATSDILSQGEPKKPRVHRRSESISTTASEVEFRLKYKTKTRRVVQRKSSMQLYQRISEKYLDEGRVVMIEKLDEDTSFGFHIKDNEPVIVSTVEEGSPAHRGGLLVGDVLISVNEVNVLEASHQEVVKLMAADTDRVKLRVVADRVPADAPLCCGYLTKQGGSGILKNWRRRWFVLKQDHCLYYYKHEEDKDPLGAILLSNYTITKAPEINRKFVFKASKYGQRTYYFQADSEEEMNGWASAMASAADVSIKKDTWLDVSSHNVGLPALAIKHPDCHGHLTKMGNRHKSWKRRYCVLKDACLYYYLDVSSSTAQGVAHLHGYTVEDSLPFNKKFGFMVIPPDKNLRTFYFSADNETDKKRWMDALQKSINRWVRADEA